MIRAVLGLAAVLAALAVTSSAAAASSYCSPTGDYCVSALRQSGAVFLQLRTFSFQGKVRVCVTSPQGKRTCKRFLPRPKGQGVYEVKVRWHRNFPRSGKGTYKVRFFYGTTPLGPVLTFRLR
ncbi:MAG TPA: hypothetical protein VH968_12555 [Gaiellaceae bacterium]